MAVTETTTKTLISMVLKTGNNPDTGKDITKNVSLGSLVINPDNQKIMNVVNKAAPIFAHDITQVKKTKTSILQDND